MLPLSAQTQDQEFQIPGTAKTVPVCRLVDLDTDVSFYHASGNVFIVAFDMKNISSRACVPQPQTGYPMFQADPAQEFKPFDLCMDCENRLPNGQYRVQPVVILSPGDVGHQTIRWRTVAPSEAVRCLQLNALFGPVLVVAPSMFAPVCSELAVSVPDAGAFVPASSNGAPAAEQAPGGELFVISSSKPRYYRDEHFFLQVALVSPGAGAPSAGDCPVLFVRQKSPDGSTRFDSVQPAGFRTCESFTWGADRNRDWQSGFQVDSGVGSRWGGLGEHSLELFEPLGSSSDGKLQFARSNTLTVQIDDPALIARKWGPKIKGVAVDVTLDNDAYQLGQDIPLHIALENFDASVPVYASDSVGDPFAAISIEVRHANGQLLQENEKTSSGSLWMGHGWPPILYPPGKLVPMERSLAAQGWLPARPGTYAVVVTWCPIDGTNYQPESGIVRKENAKPYATVQAIAAFRILGESSSIPKSQP